MARRGVLELAEETWKRITSHGVETYPEECCGIVLGEGVVEEVRPCTNIQNILHEKDPETYPRDATTAYAIDPKELESILHDADTTGASFKAFYHSHPDHRAYFSEEDRAFACPFGEPSYPQTAQIVISVMHGELGEVHAYVWDETAGDYVQVPVRRTGQK